jgi:hypothetical protein
MTLMFDKQLSVMRCSEQAFVSESCLLDSDGHFQEAVTAGGELPSR